MSLNLGLEVINFQVGNISPLAMDLQKIFQEVIDYRETFSTMSARIKAIAKYATVTMVPKLKAAIYKHTNITTTHIRLSKSLDFGWACLMEINDKEGLTAYDIIQRYSGMDTDYMVRDYMRHKKIKPVKAKDMEEIASSLNKDTGMFMKLNTEKIKCSMTMYFDPYSSFLIKEVGHEKCEYFTAAEITGIVLHEIGHMVSTIAYSANSCFQMEVYKAYAAEFNKNASKKEKVEYIKNSLKTTEIDSTLLSKFNNQIDKLPNNDTNDSVIANVVGNILSLFVAALYAYMGLLQTVVYKAISGITGTSIDALLLPLRDGIVKSSDFDKLTKQQRYCEQIADEYVTKHGMAHGQISALQKIFTYSTVQFLGTDLLSNKAGTVVYHINMLPMYVLTLTLGDITDGGGLYDGVTARCRRLVAETGKVFKNSTMSPDMIDFFISDYEASLRLVRNKTTFQKFLDTSQLIHSAIDYVIQTPVSMILTGRFFREYQALHHRAETLMSNSLFYHATKISQLSK